MNNTTSHHKRCTVEQSKLNPEIERVGADVLPSLLPSLNEESGCAVRLCCAQDDLNEMAIPLPSDDLLDISI